MGDLEGEGFAGLFVGESLRGVEGDDLLEATVAFEGVASLDDTSAISTAYVILMRDLPALAGSVLFRLIDSAT